MTAIETLTHAGLVDTTTGMAKDTTTGEGHYLASFDLLQLLRRHLKTILSLMLLSGALSYYVTQSMTPIYVADSTVVLERRESRPFESDANARVQDRDRSAAETEMDVMVSRQLLNRVIDSLNLMSNPSYNSALRSFGAKPSAWSHTVSTLRNWFSPIFGVVVEPEPIDSDADKTTARDRAISTLFARTSISRTGDSLAITISYADSSPKLAAAVSDKIADTYVDMSMEIKRQFSQEALKFLKERTSQPLLAMLRSEEARLQQSRAELAAKYGDSHPQIQAIDAKMNEARKLIEGETNKIAEDIDSETARPSARVISRAKVPVDPTYPKSGFIVTLAVLGTGLLSFLGAVMAEGISSVIRSGERTAQLLQLPNLAYVPAINRSQNNDYSSLREVVRSRHSGFSEAMRSVYLACRMPGTDRPRQVIMLTSSLPGEGKTDLALGLAATAAIDGRLTVLVDFDMLRFGVSKKVNLVESRPFLDAPPQIILPSKPCVCPDLPSLTMLAADRTSPEISALRTSDNLRELFAFLRSKFEFIVVDTPPVLLADDANWLAPLIDGAILVTKWGKTKELELTDAASSMRLNQVPMLGTVINNVNPAKQKLYVKNAPLRFRQMV